MYLQCCKIYTTKMYNNKYIQRFHSPLNLTMNSIIAQFHPRRSCFVRYFLWNDACMYVYVMISIEFVCLCARAFALLKQWRIQCFISNRAQAVCLNTKIITLHILCKCKTIADYTFITHSFHQPSSFYWYICIATPLIDLHPKQFDSRRYLCVHKFMYFDETLLR